MPKFFASPAHQGLPKKKFTPSKYQSAVFDWIDGSLGNSMVVAVAGSGKTTTIVESLSRMKGKVLFCAFNKHIALELEKRVPSSVKVSTIHGFGYSAITKAFGQVFVDKDKVDRIVKEKVGTSPKTLTLRMAVVNLCKMAKLTLTHADDELGLAELLERFDIDCGGRFERVLELAPEVLFESFQDQKTVDFDDMVWLPNLLGLNVDRYDWVCVDEAQDLNNAQRSLVLRSSKGRTIAVGDPNQAIYGFAGADTSSIPKFTKELSAKELPLSICYRCPSSHVNLARKIVPQIEARPEAPVGAISEQKSSDAIRGMESGDLVICRVNKPLANVALCLIQQGKKAVVRGRDIGKNLIHLIERIEAGSFNGFLKKLEEYRTEEVARFLLRGKEVQASSLEDRCETIFVLAKGLRTVNDLVRRVDQIFSDDSGTGVVCSTIHKAKGLEADRVFFYWPELVPHPMASSDWEYEQEMNLKYIALTRAKKELRFVPMPWKKKEGWSEGEEDEV